jgi:hypothetical protein
VSDDFGASLYADGYEDGYLQALEDLFVLDDVDVVGLIDAYARGGWPVALAFAKTRERKT